MAVVTTIRAGISQLGSGVARRASSPFGISRMTMPRTKMVTGKSQMSARLNPWKATAVTPNTPMPTRKASGHGTRKARRP